MIEEDLTFKEAVSRTVPLIPKGMVATYGQVADMAGFPGAARAVGNAVHGNTDPTAIPCHRIVHADGSLGSNYGMGGPAVQRARLIEEGVPFLQEDPARVDIARCGVVIESHPLQPFLPENGRILFLGSFPPPKTRWSMDFFYPNFNNDFWRIQGLIHFGDPERFCDRGGRRFRYDEVVSFCRESGMAFYDTASRVCRLKGNASDEFLHILEPADLSGLLDRMPSCRTVVTTGGKSSEEMLAILSGYGIDGLSVPPVGAFVPFRLNGRDLKWWRMPSSSRAYPMPVATKASYYSKLFEIL